MIIIYDLSVIVHVHPLLHFILFTIFWLFQMSSSLPIAAHPSVSHRLVGPEQSAFSPSNFSPNTITSFSNSESRGVPLQTSWTFWIHKYVLLDQKFPSKKLNTGLRLDLNPERAA